MFELAMALGDHEIAVLLAEREFGPSSKERQDAAARLRESAFREAERAALLSFRAEDWAGAAAAYRELMGRAEAGSKAELLLAARYCERLAGVRALGRMPHFMTARLPTDVEPNDSSIGPRRHA